MMKCSCFVLALAVSACAGSQPPTAHAQPAHAQPVGPAQPFPSPHGDTDRKLDAALQAELAHQPGRYRVLITFANALSPDDLAVEGLQGTGKVVSGLLARGDIERIARRPDVTRIELEPELRGHVPGGVDKSGTQGVRGRLRVRTGNFMPPVPPGYHGHVGPLVGTVYVFRGNNATLLKSPAARTALLVATLPTDADGRFAIGLSPADYTLIMEVGGMFRFDLARTVTVTQTGFVEAVIEVDQTLN